jgi:formylglycine-generating enzyme required for sulfatase activity
MWSEKKRDLLLAVSLWALAGCFAFPGMSGERCTEQGLCGSGLACDPESQTCVDEAPLLARYCRSVNCGLVQGVWCGPCSGPTEACLQNRCVDVCEGGRRCGSVEGAECGGCNASRGEVCEDTRCVGPCSGKNCGEVQGLSCGSCGSGDACESNQCVAPWGGPREQGTYVRISAGRFTMGSPANESGRDSDEVQHQVTLSRDFWLKATEVTQGEWRALMGSNPSRFSACGDACPVEQVSWSDAVDYVNALSRSVGLAECYGGSGWDRTFVGLSCRGFRLPTEAEWEYAARAGTTGERYGPLDAIAWYEGNSGGRTQPVRGKQANAWGLYDMIGNVWEWTHDWYGAYGGAATDPVGPGTGSFRVDRGGGYGRGGGYTDGVAASCRAAQRSFGSALNADDYRGFRPARSVFP